MPPLRLVAALLLFTFGAAPLPLKSAPAEVPAMRGFSASETAKELAVEQKFRAIPSPEEERRQHRIFTAEPHIAGSARNNELARYIAEEWKKQGLENVRIRRYDVYSTEPRSTFLAMVSQIGR